jgi:hypothetical protein
VAFDDQGVLLVKSADDAERCVACLQHLLELLKLAVALAPSLEEDEAYQRKRYGLLGQLVNQGRALAHYQTRQMIAYIQRRAAAGTLNRGLSLSLPYFDDRALELRTDDFEDLKGGVVRATSSSAPCARRMSGRTRCRLSPTAPPSGGVAYDRAGLRNPGWIAAQRLIEKKRPARGRQVLG